MSDELREPGASEPGEPPAPTSEPPAPVARPPALPGEPPSVATPAEPPPPVFWAPPPPKPRFPTSWGPAAQPPATPAPPSGRPPGTSAAPPADLSDQPFLAPDQISDALRGPFTASSAAATAMSAPAVAASAPLTAASARPATTAQPASALELSPPVGWAARIPAPKPEVAPGIVFASTSRRFVAYVVDNLVVAIASYLLVIAILAAIGPDLTDATQDAVTLAIVFTGLSFVYFVGTWTSRARATPGMRLLKLQVGNAFDGRTLSTGQAVRRWIVLGEPLTLVGAIPALAALSSLAWLALAIVLLLSTISSPEKQGLHDRLARSAIVEPTAIGWTAPVVALLVVLFLVFVLPILAIVFLVSLGDQVSTILSGVGSPQP